jgi:hypothetical protein
MGLKPIKSLAVNETYTASVPDSFYSAASITESERYRWVLQELGRVEAELIKKFSTPFVRFQMVVGYRWQFDSDPHFFSDFDYNGAGGSPNLSGCDHAYRQALGSGPEPISVLQIPLDVRGAQQDFQRGRGPSH